MVVKVYETATEGWLPFELSMVSPEFLRILAMIGLLLLIWFTSYFLVDKQRANRYFDPAAIKKRGFQMEKKPWEIYSALTAERLCTIGAILGNVRRKALDVYDPDEGDGPWNSECTVYQRTLNILKRYSSQYSWLVIRNIGLYFVMVIDGVPIRYYRGDFEKPHLRSLKIKKDEQGFHEQLSLLDTGNSGWYMRMVVETDIERQVANIGIMQFHEYTEDRRNLWVLPNDIISQISLASHKPKLAVIQPKALASIKKNTTHEETENEEKR